MYRPLHADFGMCKPVISVANSLTDEREAMVVADDIFKKSLGHGSSSLCALIIDDVILQLIAQAVDCPHLKVRSSSGPLGIECTFSS